MLLDMVVVQPGGEPRIHDTVAAAQATPLALPEMQLVTDGARQRKELARLVLVPGRQGSNADKKTGRKGRNVQALSDFIFSFSFFLAAFTYISGWAWT
jgi:hypothetical protein